MLLDDFQAQLFEAASARWFLSELPVRVCQHAAGGLLYSPVIILLRALFIAAITIMPWRFEEDFTSGLHHLLELLKIFVLGGEGTHTRRGGEPERLLPERN